MAVRIMKNTLLVAGLGLCFQAGTFAAEPGKVATLSNAEGTVMVDHGKGFITSKVGEALYQNDRVIALDGSLAEITYADGCRAKLKSNNLIVVSIDPGCKAAIVDATHGAPMAPVAAHIASLLAPAAGAGIGVGLATWDENNKPISAE